MQSCGSESDKLWPPAWHYSNRLEKSHERPLSLPLWSEPTLTKQSRDADRTDCEPGTALLWNCTPSWRQQHSPGLLSEKVSGQLRHWHWAPVLPAHRSSDCYLTSLLCQPRQQRCSPSGLSLGVHPTLHPNRLYIDYIGDCPDLFTVFPQLELFTQWWKLAHASTKIINAKLEAKLLCFHFLASFAFTQTAIVNIMLQNVTNLHTIAIIIKTWFIVLLLYHNKSKYY